MQKFDPMQKYYVKRVCCVCDFKSAELVDWCNVRALEWTPYGLKCPQTEKLAENNDKKKRSVKQKKRSEQKVPEGQ